MTAWRTLLVLTIPILALAMQQQAVAVQQRLTPARDHMNKTGQGDKTGRHPKDKSVTMVLDNFLDVQYTGKLQIGGQRVDAIVDTGSFELLVFSTECSSCGDKKLLYDAYKSSTYVAHDLSADHSFGSGDTTSKSATDELRIGSATIKSQGFWQVTEAFMHMGMESFQAILGVGPPASAVKIANDNLHDEQYIAELNEVGSVKHLNDISEHAKTTPSVAGNLGLGAISVCLHKEAKSNGVMIWNDHAAKERPKQFIELLVAGDTYWSTKMTKVSFKGGATSLRSTPGETQLGCFETGCSAVLDTGSSQIFAPTAVATLVEKTIDEWKAGGGRCDDLSGLPDLYFELDGHQFSLPPETYLGSVSGMASDEVSEMMPQLKNDNEVDAMDDMLSCKSIIMSDDMDSQNGPLWILGQPFFRKYYSSFLFTPGTGVHPTASSMAFSVADSKCEPSTAPGAAYELANFRGPISHVGGEKRKRRWHLHLNASSIRMPDVVRKARAKAKQNFRLIIGSNAMRVTPFVRV